MALHAGRSGAVVFDLDHPALVPDVLREANRAAQPPMQQTRLDGRGHVVYLQPAGRAIGNGSGALGSAWGDVRGQNGIILAEPTEHPDGGCYRWLRGGPVPDLPPELAACLPDASVAEVMASDDQVRTFLTAHTTDDMPDKLSLLLAMVDRDLPGSARHPLFVIWTVTAMREAAAGLYDAGAAASQLESRFIASEGRGEGRVRQPREQASEWQGILSWAVGQALSADHEATREAADAAMGPALMINGQPPPVQLAAVHPSDDDSRHQLDLARAVARLDLAAEAVRFIAERDALATFRPFDVGNLAEILARPPDPVGRVAGLIGWESSTLISAQHKTGKTTLTLNLARCLLTGQPFLGREVRTVDGLVAFLNFEVTAAQIARWADENGLPHDRFVMANLRGRGNPFHSEHDMARLAELIAGTEVLIVDPFSVAFTGEDENDAGQARRFLSRLEVFARATLGARDLILTAHAGHNPHKTRGSSALRDWPDTIVDMARDADGGRTIAAVGRDVELPPHQLRYDTVTRALTLGGLVADTEADDQRRAATNRIDDVVQAVKDRPGLGANELCERLGGRRGTTLHAIREAVAQGLIWTKTAPNRQLLHHPKGTE